jgi:TRAP-type C4-dicarboxylate transport system substrate-binding protein
MRTSIIAVMAAVAVTSACSGTPVSRSGAPTDPVVLRSTWGQNAGGVGGDVLASLIHATTDGPVSVAEGDPTADVEPSNNELEAIKALMAGDADLTVVRTGAVQQLGAASLAALEAPLVVTNNDQAAAIAADASIQEAVLADLDGMGLVGVALVPGGLRHPFAYGADPLLRAADYQDQVVNIRRDSGVVSMLDALGARADYTADDERTGLVEDGTLRGIEVSVQQYQAVNRPAVQTANVTLYAKFDIVLVRKGAWDGLSSTQQQTLHDSVVEAVRDAMATRPDEADGQAAWCQEVGAATVLATPGQLASLHARLDPVTALLAQDPRTERVLQRMRQLHEGTVDPTPAACQGPAPSDPRSAYLVQPAGDQTVFDGTWRVASTEEQLIERGVSPQAAQDNAGVWEFRFENGYADGIAPDGRPCNWEYAVNGHEFSVDWGVNGVDTCNGLMRGTWRIEDDRLYLLVEREMEYDVLLDQAVFDQGMVRVE